jgi:hypothetical protein
MPGAGRPGRLRLFHYRFGLDPAVRSQGAPDIVVFFELAFAIPGTYRLSPLCGSMSSRGMIRLLSSDWEERILAAVGSK